MRIWDVPVAELCRKHLLGEHRELHGLWNILVHGKTGYSRHPETLRWGGKLGALRLRHEEQALEMRRRGWNHKSPLPAPPVGHSILQYSLVDTVEDQVEFLRAKDCPCFVGAP